MDQSCWRRRSTEDRHTDTRTVRLSLLAQATAMLGAGEVVSTLEARVAQQPRLTKWWARLGFARLGFDMQCDVGELGGRPASQAFGLREGGRWAKSEPRAGRAPDSLVTEPPKRARREKVQRSRFKRELDQVAYYTTV